MQVDSDYPDTPLSVRIPSSTTSYAIPPTITTLSQLRQHLSVHLGWPVQQIHFYDQNIRIKMGDKCRIRKIKGFTWGSAQVRNVCKRQVDSDDERQAKNEPVFVCEGMSKEEKRIANINRLKWMKAKNATYLLDIAEGNEKIAEALSLSQAPFLQPITYRQLQLPIMKTFLHQLSCHQQILSNLHLFQTRPGLLQYFFISRLQQPIPALKILYQKNKQQFYDIFRQWFKVQENLCKNQQQQDQYVKELYKFRDEQLVSKVLEVGMMKGKMEIGDAEKIVQIAQNDYQCAMQYYFEGQRGDFWIAEQSKLCFTNTYEKDMITLITGLKYSLSPDTIKLYRQQQYINENQNFGNIAIQIFLYRWLMKKQNYLLRLRIHIEPQFLQVYMLSMKHILPGLFKLLVRFEPYIRKLMQVLPPSKSYQEPQAEAIKNPRKPDHIIYL